MKRRLSMILAFIIACALSAAAQAEGKNLLRNGEISGVFGAIPEEWRLDAWNQDDACTDAGIDPDELYQMVEDGTWTWAAFARDC